MTATWFGLALIALLGAVALLYVDRTRRGRSGRVRQIWAKAQGYRFTPEDDALADRWHRAALANQEYLTAVDVVTGVRRGEEFVLFDLEDAVTVVAVRREVGSDVDVDLRLRTTPPPKDPDMDLLGSLGPRIIFSTDLEVARRVCDQRMVAFTHSVPDPVQLLWSEGEWTLGTLSVGSSGREWDAAIDTVARLSGLLHVLPPATRRREPPPNDALVDSRDDDEIRPYERPRTGPSAADPRRPSRSTPDEPDAREQPRARGGRGQIRGVDSAAPAPRVREPHEARPREPRESTERDGSSRVSRVPRPLRGDDAEH